MKLRLFSTGDYYLSMALIDVAQAREEKKLAEAGRISAYAYQKREEYIDLITPYDGKRLVDIPVSVLKKADAAMKEAQEAERKWDKIMGIA